jgi:hypothetical protein
MRESLLRNLARSDYYQGIYSHCEKMNLSLFQNNTALSKIQLIFLNWISTYSSLYQDLATKEDYISEDVINDDIRTDAYLFWRRTIKYSKKKKKKDNDSENSLGIPTLEFE